MGKGKQWNFQEGEEDVNMKITDVKGTVTLNNGVEMPYLGLGVYQCDNEREVVNAIHYALDAGYRHIDTASFYGNEEGVGRAIRSAAIAREEIFVVTKVWNSDQGYDQTIRAFEASLKRLNLEYLDLYLVHWNLKEKSIETWRAMEMLYQKGLIRAIGVCNFLQPHLEQLIAETEIVPAVNQMEFHPRLVQQTLIDFCKSKSIQYEAWSPLMRKGIFEIEELHLLSEKYQKTVPQIVLRWDLQKGVVTIPKSANQGRVISNANIFDFEITAEDVALIDGLDRHQRIGPDPDHVNF